MCLLRKLRNLHRAPIRENRANLQVRADRLKMVTECNEVNNTQVTVPLKFVPVCQQPDFFSFGTGAEPPISKRWRKAQRSP